ncbi:hypothetical protein RRG08_043216 [Elysia crispata]|uniref:Uncharacterized protein n=1 Tax=Elysia crispata TaxID=231223 RepID=A0AAE0ZIQ0_9GAST|nr:hypothetical protein RRG08_043216 [Elysia crispata]
MPQNNLALFLPSRAMQHRAMTVGPGHRTSAPAETGGDGSVPPNLLYPWQRLVVVVVFHLTCSIPGRDWWWWLCST